MADRPWSRWHHGPRMFRPSQASKQLHDLTTEAIAEGRATQVAIARKEAGLPMKMPHLSGVASAIDKLTSAIEDDAKLVLEKVDSITEKRKRVFTKANERADARNA